MLPSFWDNCNGVCNSESSCFNIRLVHIPSLLVLCFNWNTTCCCSSYHWNRCKTFVAARVSHNGMRGENVKYFTAASLMCFGFYYRQQMLIHRAEYVKRYYHHPSQLWWTLVSIYMLCGHMTCCSYLPSECSEKHPLSSCSENLYLELNDLSHMLMSHQFINRPLLHECNVRTHYITRQ